MVPPGPHFFFTNAGAAAGEFAPTCGFFLYVEPGSVHVRRWSKDVEMLLELADKDEEARYVEGAKR
jgi:hypothetical protein